MDYPVIAAFYADIDTRGVGQVYWRASQQAEDVDRAANLVGQYYSKANFQPREVVVVTWDQVGYFDMKTDKVSRARMTIRDCRDPADKHFPNHHRQRRGGVLHGLPLPGVGT